MKLSFTQVKKAAICGTDVHIFQWKNWDQGRWYIRFSYANSLENLKLAAEMIEESLPRFKGV